MAEDESKSTGFTRGHRWLAFFNLLLASLAVFALVVMANYIAQGHIERVELSNYTQFKLSPQTRSLLNSLTNDVKVTIFYDHNDGDVYLMICSLLTEYQDASPHIKLDKIDYRNSPGEAGAFLEHLQLPNANQRDFVAFECNNRTEIVRGDELADLKIGKVEAGQPLELHRTDFLGEKRFTDAIFAVSYPREMKAYFLTGHGELDPGAPGDKPGDTVNGLTKLAAILTNDINCQWQTLLLNGTNPVPADCSLLIIATPRQERSRFSSNELTQIENYLEKDNGRLLALLDTTSGLEELLSNHWNVVVGPSWVVEQNQKNQLQLKFGLGVDFYASPAMDPNQDLHPIIKPLAYQGLSVRMALPRPICVADNIANKTRPPTLSPLLSTSAKGFQVTTDGEHGLKTYGPASNWPLLVALEQGVITGGDGTRIVLAGNSDFLSDAMIDTGANHFLADQILNWLLHRNPIALEGLGPKPVLEYRLTVTEAQTRQLTGLFLGVMPGSVLLLGGLVWLRRRS